jgi:FixJ family two-component response regulator
MGDRIQLQQALLNSLLNAAEAMREVSPVRRRMVVRAIADHRAAGPWALVSIENAGFGEAEAAPRFEAFYTTKPGGLGIGRSIRRSIIEQPPGLALGHGEPRPWRHVPRRMTGSVMSAETPIVFVVDDDRSVRDSLRRLIASVGMTVEVFPTAQAFLSTPRRDAPGCLVLDVRLPGLSGLDLQRKLVKTDATLPIIILTGHGDIPMSVRAMKAGAIEFLTKPFRGPDLLDAIRYAIDHDRTARAERHELAELRRRYDTLTPRERDVMAGVVGGLLNKHMSAEFGTTEATVKEQRGQVMQKMRAGSLAALVRPAARLGITPAGSGPTPPRSGRRFPPRKLDW